MKAPKYIRNTLLVFMLFVAVFLRNAAALDIVIGVSPHLPPAERPAVQKAIEELALNLKVTNLHLQVYDAWNLQRIADLNPGVLEKDSVAARRFHLKKDLAKLTTWFSGLGSRLGEGSESLPPGSGAIRAPEFLALLTNDGPRPQTAVVLLGSPIYLSPKEPSFSMAERRYPSDAHLACPPGDSIYSIADRPTRLSGMTVHWWTHSDQFAFPNHQTLVSRWWALYVGGQSGRLVSFGPDLAATLQRASRPGQEFGVVDHTARNPADRKVTMHTAQEREFSAANPALKPGGETVTVAPEPAPVVTIPFAAGRTGVGIAWSAPVDLDLWVRAGTGSEWVNFSHQNTREATLVSNDIRQANVGAIYEYAELNQSLDLDQIDVWIDFFDGQAEAVSGQVVLFHEGITYTGDFRIAATRGDKAAGRNDRANSRCWTRVALRDLKKSGVLVAHAPVK